MIRTFGILFLQLLLSFSVWAEENIPVTFEDVELKAGAVIDTEDPFFPKAEVRESIPHQEFLITDKKTTHTYTLRAPHGVSPEMLKEYILHKKTFYVDSLAVTVAMDGNFADLKSDFLKIKGLSEEEKTQITDAARLFDLEKELITKIVDFHIKNGKVNLKLRQQSVGFYLNFLFQRSAIPKKPTCVKVKGVDLQACEVAPL